MQDSAPGRGFSLVEMLTVIGILTLLAGLLVPTIAVVRKSERKKNAVLRTQYVSGALIAYQADFGDFPPTDWESEYDLAGNGINTGIESLVAHLNTRAKAGPYLRDFKEDDLQNSDKDENDGLRLELDSALGNAQLWELVDPWGNPFVYFHNRDYERSFDVHESVTTKPKRVAAQAAHSSKLGTWQNATTYQIWSLGPNEKNENGMGDDIGTWE